jgi:hypothetical protein
VSFFKTLRVEDEAKKIGTYAIRSPAISKNPELMRVEYAGWVKNVNFSRVPSRVTHPNCVTTFVKHFGHFIQHFYLTLESAN